MTYDPRHDPPARGTETPAATDTAARRALVGAWLGFFVDLFDIYLPIVVLAPAIEYFVSPELGAAGTAIVSSGIFAVTLIGRPVGAAIFGRLADTGGRKRTTVIAMTGAGAVTLLMALLPGYHQIGVTSVILFLALRLLAGIFLGGEYTGANPLAMEAAPRAKRGLYSGIINTGFPLAYAAISLITLLLLLLMPSQGVHSAYSQWGWRIPFMIGALLSFALAAYYHRTVSESAVFARAQRPRAPLKDLFSPHHARRFIQVFVLMTGFWLALQPIAVSLPLLLGKHGVGMTSRQVTLTLVVAYLLLAGAEVAAAVLSQRIGRKRFLIWAGGGIALAGSGLFLSVVRTGPDHLVWAITATILLVLVVLCPWAVLPAYINERFATPVRASGYGLAYSLAVVIPSFYAFYQAGLSTFMPYDHTGAVLLITGAVLILVGALAGPETTHLDLGHDDEPS